MRITRFLLPLGMCAAALGLLPVASAQQEAAKKKIVLVAGKRSHGVGEHEHRAGCMLLAESLNKSGLGVEAVVTTEGWPKDDSIFEGAAAVVIYSDGGGGHPAMRNLAKLKELADKGVGIGAIHYAVEVPKGKGGDLFLNVIGGYFETDWSVNPHWEASFKLPEHAVTSGIKDFKTTDEWYYHMRFPADMKGVTPVLTALPPAESLSRPDGAHEGNPEVRAAVLERKEPQHVMWLIDRSKVGGAGRGFGFTGGHFHKGWKNDDQRNLVLNTIVWIAGLEVPKGGVVSKTPSDEEMEANLDR